jgi:hypothetical protein
MNRKAGCEGGVSCCSVLRNKALYRVSHELRSLLRESVPYVKIYRYNPKHLCPKIPTRCSNSILFYFPLFSALHVSGVTITHHQELPLYVRVWYNNINRSLAERSVCQNRVGGGEGGSEMSPVRVSESGSDTHTGDISEPHSPPSRPGSDTRFAQPRNDLYCYTIPECTVEAPDDG